VERFREQMAYLQANDYQVIPLAYLVRALRGEVPFPDRAVVLTVDDGYKTVHANAWPILKSFGYPFTVFIGAEYLDRGYSNYLTWDQVKEMQAAGVDFQDHSFSHYHLATRPAGMDEEQYRAWIRADLDKNRARLLEKLGRSPTFLALPYGEYNNLVLEEARGLGYAAIFTQDPGSVSIHTELYRIPREPILGNEWSTMSHFREVLERVDLPFDRPEPSMVPLGSATPPRFGARLHFPERYQAESLGIYVSELGWRKGKLDGNFLSLENQTPLTRNLNRIAVSGKEKATGRTAIRFWLLMQ